jgi:hypothetical protein
MMFPGRRLLLVLICACVIAAPISALESFHAQRPKVTAPVLTDVERAIAADSRKAIIATGVSETYFDRHFTLVKVVNQPGDRRAVWKFSLNGYETTVSDVMGYYTKEGKRIDTHSVASTLRRMTEIEKTISRRAANRIMRQCIGSFVHPTIEFVAVNKEARLVLTAEAARRTAGRREKDEREREEREREARERAAKSQNKQTTDPIENEGGNGPPIVIGTVDLQSGKCRKGQLTTTP